MPARKTPKDGVSISRSGIILGDSIGAYTKKKKITKISVIINYNNNSIVIIDSGTEGYNIYHPNYNLTSNPYTIITVNVTKFVDVEYTNTFKARLLDEKSIIIENLPLRLGLITTGARMLIRPASRLIILGNLLLGRDIPPEQLERKQPKPVTAVLPLSKRPDRLVEPPTKKLEPVKPPIDDKKTANIDILDEPAPPSALEVEQKRIDNEYSKMILGE